MIAICKKDYIYDSGRVYFSNIRVVILRKGFDFFLLCIDNIDVCLRNLLGRKRKSVNRPEKQKD